MKKYYTLSIFFCSLTSFAQLLYPPTVDFEDFHSSTYSNETVIVCNYGADSTLTQFINDVHYENTLVYENGNLVVDQEICNVSNTGIRKEIEYGAQDQILDKKVFSLELNSGVWDSELLNHMEYEYDLNNNLVRKEKLTQGYHIEPYKELLTYDAGGKLVKQISYYGDYQNNSLQSIRTISYTTNQEIVIDSSFQNSMVSGLSKKEALLNIDGTVAQETFFGWYDTINGWNPSYQLQFVYSSGMLIEKYSFYWDSITNAFVDNFKLNYQYDLSGALVEKTRSGFNMSSGFYEISQREVFEYDLNGNQSQFLSLELNNSVWDSTYLSQMEYNGLGQLINFEGYAKGFHGPYWTTCCKYEICSTSVNTVEILNDKIQIYPNPTNGILNIEGIENDDQIELYNLFGQKIYQGFTSSNFIDLSGLAAKGVYILQISNPRGAKKFMQKVILE